MKVVVVMKENDDVVIIYDKNAESIENTIIKVFEKYLEINMPNYR